MQSGPVRLRLEGRPVFHRLFFAFRPDPLTACRMAVFAEGEARSARVHRWDRIHMTLGITDDFETLPRSMADHLLATGERVAARTAAIDLCLDKLSGGYESVALRPHGRPAPLRDLADALAQAMAARGVVLRRNWHFNPHVTLFYRRGGPVNRSCQPFRWRADRLVLIHSLVGRTQHLTLGDWPLLDEAEADDQGDLFG